MPAHSFLKLEVEGGIGTDSVRLMAGEPAVLTVSGYLPQRTVEWLRELRLAVTRGGRRHEERIRVDHQQFRWQTTALKLTEQLDLAGAPSGPMAIALQEVEGVIFLGPKKVELMPVPRLTLAGLPILDRDARRVDLDVRVTRSGPEVPLQIGDPVTGEWFTLHGGPSAERVTLTAPEDISNAFDMSIPLRLHGLTVLDALDIRVDPDAHSAGRSAGPAVLLRMDPGGRASELLDRFDRMLEVLSERFGELRGFSDVDPAGLAEIVTRANGILGELRRLSQTLGGAGLEGVSDRPQVEQLFAELVEHLEQSRRAELLRALAADLDAGRIEHRSHRRRLELERLRRAAVTRLEGAADGSAVPLLPAPPEEVGWLRWSWALAGPELTAMLDEVRGPLPELALFVEEVDPEYWSDRAVEAGLVFPGGEA